MHGVSSIRALAIIATIFTILTINGVVCNEDCYDDNLKITIKRGEMVIPENHCLRLSCTMEGKLFPEPCEMGIPPDCTIVDGDMTKKWPGCCPTYTCS